MTTPDPQHCVVPDCPADEMDPRGLIEMPVPQPPYRQADPACTRHFDLLVAIGMRVVRGVS